MEPVRLSDDSSDEYQMSHPGDQTGPDTEPEGGNLGGADEAAIVPRTPAARVTITPGRPLPPATFPSSSVARYSSPLGVPSTTTSGIRPSRPPGAQSTRGTMSVRHLINSPRNTVTGVEGEILGVAKDLMLQYTLYDLVFVTGPAGPRNLRAPASSPCPAPVNGPGPGVFFFNPCPCPRAGPRPVLCPDQPPVNEFSPPRAPLFRLFPS